MKAVQEEEVERGGVGFVKQVGFKPRVKERGRYGWADGETEEEEVIGEVVGESELYTGISSGPNAR